MVWCVECGVAFDEDDGNPNEDPPKFDSRKRMARTLTPTPTTNPRFEGGPGSYDVQQPTFKTGDAPGWRPPERTVESFHKGGLCQPKSNQRSEWTYTDTHVPNDHIDLLSSVT